MFTTHDKDIEYSPAADIKSYQDTLLARAIAYVAAHSPFYRDMFASHGIDPDAIDSIEALAGVPFTTKNDLHEHNARFMCVPPHKIVDYVTTSGTLGDPVTFGCTDADLDRLAYNEMKSFASAGVGPGSIVQLMTTLDRRFMAGMAYFLGLRRLGASVIRVGNGVPELQWDTIARLKPDTLMCVPSFILRLLDYADAHGIDYRNSPVRRIIGIGEGLRDSNFNLNLLGESIKRRWDVELYATYSSTEMGATFAECEHGCGGHVHPELVIVEIIGDDGLPVPDGTPGEVVVTTLGVEGMPLVRFRTGDIAAKITAPCSCGRNSYRLTPLVGRKNNMIKLKGTTLYPPAINDVLDDTPWVAAYQVVVEDSAAGTDAVTVRAGLGAGHPINPVKELKDRFRSRLRVAPEVVIADTDALARELMPAGVRKPLKFIDRRTRPTM